jgi:hypothetical protein
MLAVLLPGSDLGVRLGAQPARDCRGRGAFDFLAFDLTLRLVQLGTGAGGAGDVPAGAALLGGRDRLLFHLIDHLVVGMRLAVCHR